MRHYARIGLRVVFLLSLLFASRYLFVEGIISETMIHRFVSQVGFLAVPVFVALLALGMLLLAPPPLFIGSAAVAFGGTMGAIYSLIGVMVGAGIAFLLGRYIATDFAQKWKTGRLKSIDEWMELNGVAFTISSRLVLFANPTFNYAAGLTTVTLRHYLLGSCIGLIPSLFLMSYTFDIFTHSPTLLEALTHPAFIGLWMLRVVGVALFVALYKKYNKRRAPEAKYA